MIQAVFLLTFLIVSIISFRNIQLGFSLVVVSRLLVPRVVRINLGPAELSFGSCMTLMLIGVLLIHVVIMKRRFYSIYSRKLFKPFLIFLSLLLVSTIFGSELSFKERLFAYFEFVYTDFLLCFIAIYLFNKQQQLLDFIRILVVTAFGMGIYGIFCYLSQSNLYINLLNATYGELSNALDFFMQEERGGLSGRVMGTMLHPLAWGAVSSLLFLFFFHTNINISHLQKIILTSLFFFNAFFSGSRSALLASILGAGYVIWISGMRVKIKSLAYIFFISIIGLTALYQISVFEKYQPFFESTVFFWDDTVQTNSGIKGSSKEGRFEQLEGAMKMIDKTPTFGLGQGYIKFYLDKFGGHPILLGFESIIFTALVETGWWGLVAWFLFFVLLYKSVNHTCKKYKVPRSSFDTVVLKAFIVSFGLFIVFTNLQSVLYLFLVLYIVQLKLLVIESPAYLDLIRRAKGRNYLPDNFNNET